MTQFSDKARMRMRWAFASVDWTKAGDTVGMITLTYPEDWRAACPDGATLRRHREAFKMRWTRAFGAPVGAWATEFQRRGAPHQHLYLGMPEGVETITDWSGSDRWGWALHNWAEVVKSGDPAHAQMGAETSIHHRGSVQENANRIGDYFWRESGKKGYQKIAPEGFGSVGAFWGLWGLKPEWSEVAQLTKDEYLAMRRPLRTLRDKKARKKRRRSRGHCGLSVLSYDGVDTAVRLKRWAEGEIERRQRASEASEKFFGA